MYVHYMCVPKEDEFKQESWIYHSPYPGYMMFINESIWMVPGTVSPND